MDRFSLTIQTNENGKPLFIISLGTGQVVLNQRTTNQLAVFFAQQPPNPPGLYFVMHPALQQGPNLNQPPPNQLPPKQVAIVPAKQVPVPPNQAAKVPLQPQQKNKSGGRK